MSDRGSRAAGPSTGYPTAPVPAPESSLIGEPPPYSTCVPYSPTINSNYPDPRSPLPENSSEGSPLTGIHHHAPVTGPILHGTASTAPFLNETSGSDNHHDGYVPGANPYNPQPSFNPSYVADRPTTPRPNVYGRKTIVLTRTDAQNSARKRKLIIGLCVGVVIGSIIPIVTIIYIFGSAARRSSSHTVKSYSHETNNDLQYDGRVFNTPRHTTANPYLIDNYKNKYDDTYGSNKNSDTVNYPFLDHKYKDTVTEKPWKPKTEEDILRELGIKVPDFHNPFEDDRSPLRNRDRDFPNPIIQPFTMSSEMKDLLGIPRDEETTKKPRI